MKRDLVIIGAGPSGLMAGITARRRGVDVCIIEQNDQIGCKILISGGGRCNITNLCSKKEFLSKFYEYKNFFCPAFYNFSNYDAMDFFKSNGLDLRIEDDGRVFPKSNKSVDVVRFFYKMLSRYRVDLIKGCRVIDVYKEAGDFMITTTKGDFIAKQLAITTGALGFANKCGCRGDGFRWAKNFGHTITKLVPHLCSLDVKELLSSPLKGISLKDVVLTHNCNRHTIKEERGAIVFTANGISGPVVHNVSRFLLDCDFPKLCIDFFPEKNFEWLRYWFLEKIKVFPKKKVKNILSSLLPERLAGYICDRVGLRDRLSNQLSRTELHNLLMCLKRCSFEVIGSVPLDWAFVTAGGVSIEEVNPKTMQSKLISGLFFAGEVLEPVGPSGGFNIQFALSTGFTLGATI